MNRLHLWSDIPGQLFKASTESDAVGRARTEEEEGHRTLTQRVDSVNDLLRLFTRLAQEPAVWDSLNFHTHGSGGSIALGSTSLNIDSLQRFENQDFDRLFSPTCVITFDGCNVAEGPEGEYFLALAGNTFLTVKGGKVRGNTGAGFGNWGRAEDSRHPFGEWITATVGPGGTIRFDKLNHLHPQKIDERVAQLVRAIQRLEKNLSLQEKREMQDCLDNARAWGVGRWHARLQSCLWLDKADAISEKVELRSMRRPSR